MKVFVKLFLGSSKTIHVDTVCGIAELMSDVIIGIQNAYQHFIGHSNKENHKVTNFLLVGI